MQVHIHARQAARRRVFFLPIQRDGSPRLIPNLEQQRPRPTRRVIDSCICAGLRFVNADDLRHDLAHFAGRVELSLALAALRGKVPHEILIRVAENVIPIRAVLRKIQRLVLEDGDQVGETFHLLLAIAQFGRVVEIGKVRK